MSDPCASFSNAPDSIAQGLNAIDCTSGVAIHQAFERFFGPDGTLGGALTMLMTLYVGLMALKLLTGRGGLSITALTPRMLGLGLALTFATSWVAYQNVTLNLALGAPDQIAQILVGSKGSATTLFANRLDAIFNAIANAAQNAPAPIQGVAGQDQPPASAADLLWFAALMLLLGTVGVLLVAKIALAAMLALGPIFIILSLFQATRGLFEGWLKTVVMLALTPLLAVILGGGTVALIGPMVDDLASGVPDMRVAVTIFLAAAVHVTLMLMALKAASMLVSGWRLPKTSASQVSPDTMRDSVPAQGSNSAHLQSSAIAQDESSRSRVQAIVAHMEQPMALSERRTEVVMPINATYDARPSEVAPSGQHGAHAGQRDGRTRSIGQHYRKAPHLHIMGPLA